MSRIRSRPSPPVPLSRLGKARVGRGGTRGEKRAHYCYIVECADGTLYTGWTVDVEARVKVHNVGRGARYTKTRRPVTLIYSEPQPSRAAAMRREAAIKKMKRAAKFTLALAQRRKGAKTQSD